MGHRRHFLPINPTWLLLTILLMIVAVMLSTIKINQVQVKGQLSCGSVDQVSKQSQLQGQSWILINSDRVNENLQKQFICLEEVRVKRIIPDIVELILSERQPVLVVQLANKVNFPDLLVLESTISSTAAEVVSPSQSPPVSMVIDRLGVAFSQDLKRAGQLPHIFLIDHPLALGQQLSSHQVGKILTILGELSQLGIAPGPVRLIRSTLVTGNSQIIFSLDRDVRRQLASLQLIWQKAKIDSKPIDKLDLRFDKPVVVYSPLKKE